MTQQTIDALRQAQAQQQSDAASIFTPAFAQAKGNR